MKNKSIPFIIRIFILLVVSLVLLPPSPSHAQETFSLSVKPSVASLTVSTPDEETSQTFTLTNNSDSTQTILIQVFPIRDIDKKTNRLIYQPISELSEGQQSFYQNAISFESRGKKVGQITLAPKQEEEIELKVYFNPDQNDSEYYFTLGFIANQPDEQQAGEPDQIKAVSLVSGGVGSNVLVSLGDRKSDIAITEFKSTRLFSSILPNLTLSVKNLTDKHNKIFVSISIHNILGVEIARAGIQGTYIVGGRGKLFEFRDDSYSPHESLWTRFSVGINTVKLNLYESDKQRQYSRELHYLALPLPGVIVSSLTLVIVLILLRRIKRKLS